MSTDSDTKNWIRNAADDRAARAGMVFDIERGQFVCDWIESTCCLYEGDRAGELLELIPYQRDYVMRLFGWVRPSRDRGCWVRRFRNASLWAGKKQGKSPLCAAVNLFLTCADGEPGNKVFQGAANGEQATIAQAHAVNMVLQSPALLEECKVHGSTFTITHLPTRSKLLILAGDNKRGAKSKEGLNGSVVFDEMHVVDRTMYARTSRAGISRKEPLVLSYSTAGDDTDSVGYERWDYGRQVNSGERDDLRFLHVEYSAPECSEGDIEARLEELGRAANPAWGILVNRDNEFFDDWQASKISSRKIAEFVQYRLNRWVSSSTRWLDQAGWSRGERDYSIGQLAGRECHAAIDLSRTRDMTSCVFAFPFPEEGPDTIRLWPMFWLPEKRAAELHHRYPYLDWAKQKHLTLTRGSTVGYGQVKDDIRKVIEDNKLIVLSLHYDEHYANEISQALHEGETIEGHSVPGVVAMRVVFPQQMMAYSPPSKEFERRVIDGQIQHPGNGVLTWQVSHCEVKTDENRNIRPVKPDPDSAKSIDGVQCCVMTMGALTAAAVQGTEWPADYFDGIWFEEWPKNLARRIVVLTRGQEHQAHVRAGLGPGGILYFDAEIAREDNTRMVERATALARAWMPVSSIAIEDVAVWNELVPIISAVLGREKQPLPWQCLHGTTADRAERIRRVTWYLSQKLIRVKSSRGGRELVRQWQSWPHSHDEAAEAVGTAIQRLQM